MQQQRHHLQQELIEAYTEVESAFAKDLTVNEDGTEVEGLSLDAVSDRFREHELTLAENMYFFNKLDN